MAANRAVFPATLRLRQAAEFGQVFRRNRRSHDRFFTVLGRPNQRADARLGLAVSKKACKSAVGRNRLKRLIRESFRRQRSVLPAVDLVVMAKREAAAASAATLSASLTDHWQEIAKQCAG